MGKRKSPFELHIETELRAQTESNHDQMARLLAIVGMSCDLTHSEKIQYLLLDYQRLTHKEYKIGQTSM